MSKIRVLAPELCKLIEAACDIVKAEPDIWPPEAYDRACDQARKAEGCLSPNNFVHGVYPNIAMLLIAIDTARLERKRGGPMFLTLDDKLSLLRGGGQIQSGLWNSENPPPP